MKHYYPCIDEHMYAAEGRGGGGGGGAGEGCDGYAKMHPVDFPRTKLPI